MTVHVIPINDEREHYRSTCCWCSPRVDGSIIVHNSADCREQVERLIGEGVSEDKNWGTFLVEL